MTGCGCLLLLSIVVGLIAFMLFGSTDPGEPVEQAVALVAFVALLAMRLAGAGVALVPCGRDLVRTRNA